MGPSSPAVLLVAGRYRWVPGWPYYLAASMAHRQRARVTMLWWSFFAGAWFDSGYMFQRRRIVEVPISVRYAQSSNCASRRLPCHGAEDVPLVPCSRPQRFPSCSLLIRYSTSLSWRRVQLFTGAGRAADFGQRFPTVALVAFLPGQGRRDCAGPAVRVHAVRRQFEIPQFAARFFWTLSFARPLCATTDAHFRCPSQFIHSCVRPCDHACRWKCPRFRSSRIRWTFQLATETGARLFNSFGLMAAMTVFFDAFCVIFRAPPVFGV